MSPPSTTPKYKRNVPVDVDEYQEATENHGGWCVACQAFTHYSAEPDARKYQCPACGKFTVYGAEEAAMCGLISVEGGGE